MLIYCSHKFGGSMENAKAVELKIKRLQLADASNTYISPIHAFGFLYNEVDYLTGLNWCLELLSKCDMMIVLSEMSKGVRAEIKYCIDNAIPFVFVEEL